MASAFANKTFIFVTDPAFNVEMNDKVNIDGDNTITYYSNVNNTATRNVHGGLNSMFSGNIFGDVVKQSMKTPHLLQKCIGG